jgi:hypothetical protein
MTNGTRRERGVSVTPRPLFTPGKTRYPLYRRLGEPQGRSGQLRKISPSTGIRSPDRPARSQSLYRLHYPGDHIRCHLIYWMVYIIYVGKNAQLIRREYLCRIPNDCTARVQMFYYAIYLTLKTAEILEVRNVDVLFDSFIYVTVLWSKFFFFNKWTMAIKTMLEALERGKFLVSHRELTHDC